MTRLTCSRFTNKNRFRKVIRCILHGKNANNKKTVMLYYIILCYIILYYYIIYIYINANNANSKMDVQLLSTQRISIGTTTRPRGASDSTRTAVELDAHFRVSSSTPSLQLHSASLPVRLKTWDTASIFSLRHLRCFGRANLWERDDQPVDF